MTCYVLGIDIGTTGCKSSLYDVEGNFVAGGYQEYFLSYPGPGQVEIDPDNWWEAVKYTLNYITQQGYDLARVEAIGISCTNAILPVGKDGYPLRKAIMQLDQRTDKEIDWIKNNIGEAGVFEVTGNRIAPGTFSAPAILWIKKNEPQVFLSTHKFLVPTGYIVYKLTGNYSIDPSRASTTMLFDIKKMDWDQSLCEAMGIPLEMLPEIIPSQDIAGFVSGEAAIITGLKRGIPVIAGCMDTVAGALGSGIFKIGDAFAILGTVGRLGVCLKEPIFDSRFVNCCYGLPGTWVSMAAINAVGASYRWFRDSFAKVKIQQAEKMGGRPYEIMNGEAEKSPAGSRGIIYLPYLAAERSPLWDSNVSAAFLGLTISHEREDIIRSLLEGVSYAFRNNLEIFRNDLGFKMTDIVLSGGGAGSKIWRQILADVLGVKVHLLANLETETLGSALLAARGTGLIKGDVFLSFTPELVETRVPDISNKEVYNSLYSTYRELYQRLRVTNEELSNIRKTYF